ncbi:interleukin-36 gamma isoform X1 [Pan paniscus]|uniref:interleukin-36 gamma isoform X1 n=1 Tax=Pan paniscus TaxID=9597 RepID=UPI00254650A0|nr:interleukin-36 gamma isoform X1 [Pan paniscus]
MWIKTARSFPLLVKIRARGLSFFIRNVVTMTSLCKAAAGLSGNMPVRYLGLRTASPAQGPDVYLGAVAGGPVCAPRMENAQGKLRQASGRAPPAGRTHSVASYFPGRVPTPENNENSFAVILTDSGSSGLSQLGKALQTFWKSDTKGKHLLGRPLSFYASISEYIKWGYLCC